MQPVMQVVHPCYIHTKKWVLAIVPVSTLPSRQLVLWLKIDNVIRRLPFVRGRVNRLLPDYKRINVLD